MALKVTDWGNSVANWFNRHKERIGIIAIGHGVKHLEEYIFDWLVYGIVVAKCLTTWGPYKGALIAFAIMTPLSALICFGYIRFYDWAKVDWLGIETFKELHEIETEHWFGRFLQKMLHYGQLPAFIFLSIFSDPFVVTVYFRKGAHKHDGLTPRDWGIFFASVMFTNAYWTLGWTVAVEIFQSIWAYLSAIIQ